MKKKLSLIKIIEETNELDEIIDSITKKIQDKPDNK